MKKGQDIQHFLIGMRGIKNMDGHCIFVMNVQIFDAIYINSLQLTVGNLDYVLGETVTEVDFCYCFYPNQKFMLEGIEIENYQQIQDRKRKEKRERVTCRISWIIVEIIGK